MSRNLKITKPFRFTADFVKWIFRRREKHVFKRAAGALRKYGIRGTWHNLKRKVDGNDTVTPEQAAMPLFTEAEFEEQRRETWPEPLKFSIVVPLYNTPEQFLREMIESVQAQTYADWELCIADGSDDASFRTEEVSLEYARKDPRVLYQKLDENGGISGNTNAAILMASGDYIGLFDHDDWLHPAALYEVRKAIRNLRADYVYTDEAVFLSPDRSNLLLVHLKPDFAPDNLRANNYICHFSVFRKALLEEVGMFDPACDGSQDHDMILRLTAKAKRVAHIPEVLYYWRAHAKSVAGNAEAKPYVTEAGVRAVAKSLSDDMPRGEVTPVGPGMTVYRIQYEISGNPKVSVLITDCKMPDGMKRCLKSVLEKTSYQNYEVVIVLDGDDSSDVEAACRLYGEKNDNVRIVSRKEPFASSSVVNFGAERCEGDYILLLHGDTEIISVDWMQEMLMFAQRTDVGAVGAKLYYRNDTVQHAGIGVGVQQETAIGEQKISESGAGADPLQPAGYYFSHIDRASGGYCGRLLYAQNVSAVSGGCMLIRRDVWERFGGFSEAYRCAWNDVDFCLRLRREGFLVVWTPFAELYHDAAEEQSREDGAGKERYAADTELFSHTFAQEIAAGDPYFNPNFVKGRMEFVVHSITGHFEAR